MKIPLKKETKEAAANTGGLAQFAATHSTAQEIQKKSEVRNEGTQMKTSSTDFDKKSRLAGIPEGKRSSSRGHSSDKNAGLTCSQSGSNLSPRDSRGASSSGSQSKAGSQAQLRASSEGLQRLGSRGSGTEPANRVAGSECREELVDRPASRLQEMKGKTLDEHQWRSGWQLLGVRTRGADALGGKGQGKGSWVKFLQLGAWSINVDGLSTWQQDKLRRCLPGPPTVEFPGGTPPIWSPELLRDFNVDRIELDEEKKFDSGWDKPHAINVLERVMFGPNEDRQGNYQFVLGVEARMKNFAYDVRMQVIQIPPWCSLGNGKGQAIYTIHWAGLPNRGSFELIIEQLELYGRLLGFAPRKTKGDYGCDNQQYTGDGLAKFGSSRAASQCYWDCRSKGGFPFPGFTHVKMRISRSTRELVIPERRQFLDPPAPTGPLYGEELTFEVRRKFSWITDELDIQPEGDRR